MKSLSVSRQSSSSRRALLLGLTLAEIMLIILFALLLLLGATGKRAHESETANATMFPIVDALKIDPEERAVLTEEDIQKLESLFVAIQDSSGQGETISDSWTRVERLIRASTSVDERDWASVAVTQAEELDRKSRENDQLRERLEEMSQEVEAAEQYVDALVFQVEQLRGGAPPPCLYSLPSSEDRLRGPSVPLGHVLIESDRMEILTIYGKELRQPLVDFFGRPVDISETIALLQDIRLNVPLDMSEFERYSKPLYALSQVDSDNHRKCYFTMNYSMADGVPLRMFTDVFQSYFLPQRRIP